MSWHACGLGDVVTLKRGHDLPDSQRQDGDVPVVSSSGITGRHSEPKAKAPGVVTGRYGTLGEVFYIEEDYWPLNTARHGFQRQPSTVRRLLSRERPAKLPERQGGCTRSEPQRAA